MTYKDPRTLITFYVESDGRHIAAIDADGKLLWVRNPNNESRTNSPENQAGVIVRITQHPPPTSDFAAYLERHNFGADDKLLEITFASNFFGVLNERTGDFVLIGIN
jgi:hypothetical protein